ncbi:lytic polysaccharide monooxygenase [Xylariaceae sp. AK1471]|nr:lytic polysaccharide monooxygenase [Xylariaceae sp. AK1471]
MVSLSLPQLLGQGVVVAASLRSVTIPSDIPAGKGVIGFTWFNRVGNREMYMNCGALELTGTGGDMSNSEKLPDMVVLSIGSDPKTLDTIDYDFEDPGSFVENNFGEFGVAICGNDGIGLSGFDARNLKDKSEQANERDLTANQSLDLAFLPAQLRFRHDNVDVSPVNQTLAGENWHKSDSYALRPSLYINTP